MFLDELIAEYVAESSRLLDVLARAIDDGAEHEIKETLHALRGSALSVGAISMKMICKRLERLILSDLKEQKEEIFLALNHAFTKLCKELDLYQQQRVPQQLLPMPIKDRF